MIYILLFLFFGCAFLFGILLLALYLADKELQRCLDEDKNNDAWH